MNLVRQILFSTRVDNDRNYMEMDIDTDYWEESPPGEQEVIDIIGSTAQGF